MVTASESALAPLLVPGTQGSVAMRGWQRRQHHANPVRAYIGRTTRPAHPTATPSTLIERARAGRRSGKSEFGVFRRRGDGSCGAESCHTFDEG